MATELPPYHEHDTDPFAGPVHVLVNTGGGPDEVDLDFRDRDVVVRLSLDHTTVRVLHLQNVRADTVAEARAAVDDFLARVKLADDRRGNVWPGREAHTMSEAYEEVHPALCDYVEEKAKELGVPADWSHGGFSRDTMRNTFSQPRYRVRICEDGAVELTTGTRGVPTRCKRGPAEVKADGWNYMS